MSIDDFSQFTEHRTGHEMNQLLHHDHFIAVGRGFAAKFVEERFPGWEWRELLTLCHDAGIVVSRGPGVMPVCDSRVKRFHFSKLGFYAIEWSDGLITRQDDVHRGILD